MNPILITFHRWVSTCVEAIHVAPHGDSEVHLDSRGVNSCHPWLSSRCSTDVLNLICWDSSTRVRDWSWSCLGECHVSPVTYRVPPAVWISFRGTYSRKPRGNGSKSTVITITGFSILRVLQYWYIGMRIGDLGSDLVVYLEINVMLIATLKLDQEMTKFGIHEIWRVKHSEPKWLGATGLI